MPPEVIRQPFFYGREPQAVNDAAAFYSGIGDWGHGRRSFRKFCRHIG